MNHDVNTCVFQWSLVTPVKGSVLFFRQLKGLKAGKTQPSWQQQVANLANSEEAHTREILTANSLK